MPLINAFKSNLIYLLLKLIQYFRKSLQPQGCALAVPGGPRDITFSLWQLGNLSFCIEFTLSWRPYILQVQRIGLPSVPYFVENSLATTT